MEPAKGGKVPEAAHLRVDLSLNMIDTVGLRDPEGIRMERMMAAESPELLENMLQDTNSNYQPGMSTMDSFLNVPENSDTSITFTRVLQSNLSW